MSISSIETFLNDNVIGILISIAIFTFLYYLSCKVSGINKYDRTKDYKKETEDESDLEAK